MVREQIRAISAHIPEGVTLVCVSKFHPAEAIREAYEAGERHFGESRVQELQQKVQALPSDICWHFIGHLQTNKVHDLLKLRPFLIESVDSVKLLQVINDEAAKQGFVQDVLLEVHVAREETKSGFLPEELSAVIANGQTEKWPNVHVRGLMTMATNTEDEQEIRRASADGGVPGCVGRTLRRGFGAHRADGRLEVLARGASRADALSDV